MLAVVNGDVITVDDLRQAILDRYYGKQALVALVRKRLFLAEAERRKIVLEPAQLDAQAEVELEELLQGMGASRQFFIDDLRLRGLEVSDVRDRIRRELEDRVLIERLIQSERNITEAQVRARFEETFKETRVRARHIAFPFRVPGSPDDAVVAETRNRAEEARASLLGGQDFGELARSVSGNPETSSRGGEIGWVRSGMLPEELTSVIFRLPPGQVSEPVRESDYGYHLLEVEERQEAQPLSAVREQIREQLRSAEPTPLEIFHLEERLRRDSRIDYYWEAQDAGQPGRAPASGSGDGGDG